MRIDCKFWIVVILCFVLVPFDAQQGQSLKKAIQTQLDSLQRANAFPGLTFCAILPNGEKITVASGWADSLSKAPMKTSHRMLSGSNGKTLFVAAALKMASEKYYELDNKISQYLGDEDWFANLPNAHTITMRMLMNHTSGIEEYYELGDFMKKLKENPNKTFTPQESISYVLGRSALFEAGSAWGYADTNYIVMAYVLEKIAGRKMYDIIQEQLIKPYQLTQTEPSIKRKFKNLATGYSRKGSPFPFEGAVIKNGELVFSPQFEWAGGGFVSNVQDLAYWAKSLYGLKEISPEILSDMRLKVPANTGKDHAYGLGVQIRPSAYGDTFGHSGWFPGYLTDAIYIPEKNLALAIQFNTDNITQLKMAPYSYLQLMAKIILNNLK